MRKFDIGDKVIVIKGPKRLVGKTGTIVGYDIYPRPYAIDMETGSRNFFNPWELEIKKP